MKEVLNPCIAMGCITALVVLALMKGYDGLILGGALTVIGGLGGFTASQLIARREAHKLARHKKEEV